jgi:hypothetical protein
MMSSHLATLGITVYVSKQEAIFRTQRSDKEDRQCYSLRLGEQLARCNISSSQRRLKLSLVRMGGVPYARLSTRAIARGCQNTIRILRADLWTSAMQVCARGGQMEVLRDQREVILME